MVNVSTLQTAFKGLVGLRSPDDPDYAPLSSDITTSSSGLYFDDFHPLCTLENIASVSPNYDGFNYSAWSALTTYTAGQKVIDDNVAYIALTNLSANLNKKPSSNIGTFWRSLTENWIQEKINSSINKLLNAVLTRKKLNGSTKAYMERVMLFTGDSRASNIIIPRGRRVGFEVRLKRSENIQAVIDYVGGMFSSVQNLAIDLHNSSQADRVGYCTFTGNGASSFKWVAPTDPTTGWKLDFVSFANSYNPGGAWYISYNEDNLVGNAIQTQFDFQTGPCCPGHNMNLFNQWSKWIELYPFEVASGNFTGTALWDLSKLTYSSGTNYGLNLSISIKPELTELFTQNKDLFTQAIGTQFAFDMLTEMLNNPGNRINNDTTTLDKRLLSYELSGDKATNKKGLGRDLDDIINALSTDLSNLSAVLPIDKPSGVKYGAF